MEPNISTGQFESGVVAISSASFVEILALAIDGLGGDVFVHGDVTGDALADFKITWSPEVGGTHTTLLAGTDFNTPSKIMPVATNGLSTTAAAAGFDILLANLNAVAELKFWAKDDGAGSSIALTGKVGRPLNQQ